PASAEPDRPFLCSATPRWKQLNREVPTGGPQLFVSTESRDHDRDDNAKCSSSNTTTSPATARSPPRAARARPSSVPTTPLKPPGRREEKARVARAPPPTPDVQAAEGKLKKKGDKCE